MDIDDDVYQAEEEWEDGTLVEQGVIVGEVAMYSLSPRSSIDRVPRKASNIPRAAEKPALSRRKPTKRPVMKTRRAYLDISTLTDEQVALAALQSDQVLHLKLRKKYYAEALKFIRTVEGGMSIVAQLLGSTNKAEQLESMEFFRVAWEYHFDSAEV